MTQSIVENTTAEEEYYAFPVSLTQEGLWFLHQLDPQSAAYNVPAVLRIKKPVDEEIIARSLNLLVQRHEALRTTFHMRNGEPMQMVASSLEIALRVIDLQGRPEEKRKAEEKRLASEELQRPFNLERGPLLRATLLKLAPEEALLLLTVHHIVIDGWSVGVVVRELIGIYEALSTAREPLLPELPLQYADYAIWQRELLQGETLAEQLGYWQRQLKGRPDSLKLPADRSWTPQFSLRGASYKQMLPEPLATALRHLSRQRGVTLYMTLVAAFQTLLHRYTGQEDLLLGTLASGRTQAETRDVVGFFVNTLVLRADLSGNPTFHELLERVRKVVLEAQEHQDLPFAELVKAVQPERQSGRNPLFQVMLSMEPSVGILPMGWELATEVGSTVEAQFELALDLRDRADGLACFFEYRTELFDEATIARLAGHWQALLEGIVASPEQCISDLPLLPENERQRMLIEWNATEMEYPREKCLHELFEAQVERTPEAIAVVFEAQRLTYRELDWRANQLARRLRELGVGQETLVGLCVERSLEMMVGLLGILKAGAAYVPMDPGFPAERLAFMLEDAQAPVLVTQEKLALRLPAHSASVLCLDRDREALARESEQRLVNVARADNLAYVIYTSGSTGRPKGVQIPHRAVVNFLLSMQKEPGLMAEDRLLAVTTLSFDIAGLELYLPLITGARVIIASREVALDGSKLLETLQRTGATVMQATPVTWRILLGTGWQGDRRLKVLCGGEAFPPDLAQHLAAKAGEVWNLYGPTETTIWSSVCQIKVGETTVSIGHPIANTQLYVLDRHMQPAPVGVAGELLIGGDGLARGYLRRPELTEERFIKHPFSEKEGERLYRTGDLARYRADGTIEHLGRLDFQVKIRGYRIELGEIEAVLSEHAAVRQAVVVAHEDTSGEKRLVAYLVSEQAVETTELKRHMQARVPAYMVPSAFMMLEAFPLTPNGKVDRRALPEPEPAERTANDTFVAPSTPTQYRLVQIWEELLNVRPVGIRDNFFEIGGHSLLAVRLFDRIAGAFGKKLPLSTLFAGATIEHLATALAEGEEQDTRTPLVMVQVGTSGHRPFFYLHGEWTGGAFYSLDLARHLGPDQPFYVLEPYRFEGLDVPPTFEEMATAHIQAMRAVQPEGPYLLGGWCNGGLLAYEMARQLQAQSQKVDLLVLMDPSTPAINRQEREFIARLGNLSRISQKKQVDWFLWYRNLRLSFYHWRKRIFSRAHSRLSETLALEQSADTQATQAGIKKTLRQDWFKVYGWIVAGYLPHPYGGRVAFFWTEEEPERKDDWQQEMGTQTEVKNIQHYTIPGNHITCRTVHLPALAERLRSCLAEAQIQIPQEDGHASSSL